MPTYEYYCNVCSKEFEAVQRMSDKPEVECPMCRVMCHNRLISGGTSFSLKGDGWGSDNYSKKPNGAS